MANHDESPVDRSPAQSQPEPAREPGPTEPGLKDIVRSVLAAALGVQSRKNQERDFAHGKARVFVVAGIVFTLLFIATVFSIVTIVLKTH